MNRRLVRLGVPVLVLAGCIGCPWSAATAQTPAAPSLAPGSKVVAARIVIPNAATAYGETKIVNGSPVYMKQKDAPYIVITRPIPKSRQTYDLYLIQTRDEILVPMAVRKPKGKGPFPAILLGSGNGIGDFERLDKIMYLLEPMIDRMIKRGYVVAYGNYRTMVWDGFNAHDGRAHRIYDTTSGTARNIDSEPALDSDDYVSMIQQLQALPFVEPDAVGSIGVSHSGELLMEAAMFTTWAAAVNAEGATWQFSRVDLMRAPHEGRTLLLEDSSLDLVKSLMDKDITMERLRKIKTPLLQVGRPKDELSGLFRVMYEWSKEAGLDTQWMEFDHPQHGYVFLYRNGDGSFHPDPMQEKAFSTWMAFMDKHLKPAREAGSK